MTQLLALAPKLAVDSHAGQTNMDGTLYILHPLRIMMQCKTEEEQIVAILHDAVEDTSLTLDTIRAEGLRILPSGFSEKALHAIDLLTKREGEDYFDNLAGVATSPLATRIKLLDLRDNIDLTRLPVVTQRDLDRAEKYHRAIRFMEKESEEKEN